MMIVSALAAGAGGFVPTIASCECTGDNHGIPADAGFPAAYGTSCKAWDSVFSITPCDTDGAASWCELPWCYVSPDCPAASPSVYFDGAKLSYAYISCGATDTFTATMAHATEVANSEAIGMLDKTGDGIICSAEVDEYIKLIAGLVQVSGCADGCTQADAIRQFQLGWPKNLFVFQLIDMNNDLKTDMAEIEAMGETWMANIPGQSSLDQTKPEFQGCYTIADYAKAAVRGVV